MRDTRKFYLYFLARVGRFYNLLSSNAPALIISEELLYSTHCHLVQVHVQYFLSGTTGNDKPISSRGVSSTTTDR